MIRTTEEGEGSLQQFILSAKMGNETSKEDKRSNPDFMKQVSKMMLLDMLVNNYDRHDGNYLVDKDGRLYAIDNGYTFGKGGGMPVYMYGVNMEASSLTYDDESVTKIQEFSKDKDKKKALYDLLRELLGEKEVKLFFKRLELIAKNIVDGRISPLKIDQIYNELQSF